MENSNACRQECRSKTEITGQGKEDCMQLKMSDSNQEEANDSVCINIIMCMSCGSAYKEQMLTGIKEKSKCHARGQGEVKYKRSSG